MALQSASHASGVPSLSQSTWHSSGTPLASQSLKDSQSSGVPLALQSASQPSGTPSESQSASHSSGMPLALQSWLFPPVMSSPSGVPLPLQSISCSLIQTEVPSQRPRTRSSSPSLSRSKTAMSWVPRMSVVVIPDTPRQPEPDSSERFTKPPTAPPWLRKMCSRRPQPEMSTSTSAISTSGQPSWSMSMIRLFDPNPSSVL